MSNFTTLNEFILDRQGDFPFASGELTRLLNDIGVASKIVNKEVRRAGLGNILGKLGIQGKDRGEATKRVREMIGGKIEKEGVGVEITRENIESWALGK